MVQGCCCFVCFSINQTYAGFYRVAQNFCGSLFLQIGNFMYFAGTNLRLGQIGFSCWKLIFAIFRNSMIIFLFLLRMCNEIINNITYDFFQTILRCTYPM